MRLYLIRHGQSSNNVLDETTYFTQRTVDPTLTAIGFQQAERVAQYLATQPEMPTGDFGAERHANDQYYRFTHLYCSPMLRALQTTQPISTAMNMPVTVWEDVHEHGGMYLEDQTGTITGYTGMTHSEIQAKFPTYELPPTITENGWWDAARGRESWADFYGRAVRVALALQARAESDDHIAIVCHGLFMDTLLKALTQNLPPQPNSIFYAHWNTAITRVDFNERPDILRLHYHNRVEHLPPELRTW